MVDEENDKPTVIALSEIELGLITADILTEIPQEYEIIDAVAVAVAELEAAAAEAPQEPII